MSTLLHLSDTHFGTEVPPVVEALVALARDAGPDLVVLSGDITQRARSRQFAAARAFVDRLAAPRTLVLAGNHDIPLFNLPARAFAPYAGFQRHLGADLEPSFESDELLVLGVKTTRRWRHTDGEVSPGQIDRVATRLRAARPAQLRVVVTHQPLHVARPKDRKDLLRGHAAALEAWSAAGADLVLCGHIHLPQMHDLGDRLPRTLWSIIAGTATSSRVRPGAPNSVNLIRYAPPGDATQTPSCAAERWDYDARARCFARVQAVDIRLARSAPAPHGEDTP